MMSCFIIDDEWHCIKVVEEFARSANIRILGVATNALEGLKKVSALKPNILFCDMVMPDINGLEMGQLVSKDVMTVFVTAHRNYAVESYNVAAVDYLTKPLRYEHFERAIAKCQALYNLRREAGSISVHDSLIVKEYNNKSHYLRVPFNDIIYLCSSSNLVEVWTKGVQLCLKTYSSLIEIEPRLTNGRFVRVSRSHIVNLDFVSGLRKGKIFLEGKERAIPLGDIYKKEFMSIWSR